MLHDRRIPGSKANLDHIAVTPSGVYVIDAQRYRGRRPQTQVDSGLFRPRTEHLIVGRRDSTKLVVGMHKQVQTDGLREFYICPGDKLRSDVGTRHMKFLAIKGGARPRNPLSKHAGIYPEQMRRWQKGWRRLA